jgi:hypothetical protein
MIEQQVNWFRPSCSGPGVGGSNPLSPTILAFQVNNVDMGGSVLLLTHEAPQEEKRPSVAQGRQ